LAELSEEMTCFPALIYSVASPLQPVAGADLKLRIRFRTNVSKQLGGMLTANEP
jgi:hypothetical protein